ncbi:MAG: bifunctional tRNA (5-methylaminomethyl-2-thiouridine)(34)-methyltransferase MnmD/FAD-dependent 5-carboxymethylaminomethyl-2-thiouridine(34) oxidoreductase MnmC [Pseudomonadota bacterium]
MQKSPDQILENAEIVWQENGAPYSSRFADIYFSRQGGLEETEHVFIAANRLQERWQTLDTLLREEVSTDTNSDRTPQRCFTIAELGLGTGLNFLCCWRAWQQLQPTHLRLHYIACEKFPMQTSMLAQALASWPELSNFSVSLLNAYPDHSPGYHRLQLHSQDGGSAVTLDLYYGDAAEMLAAQPLRDRVKVDAWFLDGFAPRVNPDMWSTALLATMARLSRSGTTLSTYSVAGQVVRNLQECGFQVSKQPGFGQKRHMLHGEFVRSAQTASTSKASAPWLQLPDYTATTREVIVIGAGLAGCSAAYALARRGFHVTVLEQHGEIASGASGNRQAVLQCRLSNAVNAGWQFNLQAFLYASRHFNAIQRDSADIQWHPCGVLNLDTAFSSRRERCPEVRLEFYSEQVVRRVEQQEAAALCGMAIDGGGNFLPLGGWLNPVALCRAWLQHPLIQFVGNTPVERLEYQNRQWQIFSAGQSDAICSAPTVIIANSFAAQRFSQTACLSLTPLRGQVSYLQESAATRSLRSVVCGLSYVSPAHAGQHSAGASYSKDVSDLAISSKEHQENVAGISDHFEGRPLSVEALNGGRVSVRASTGDRMPIAGPVPDFAALAALYPTLKQWERQAPTQLPPCLPGLYINVGHGSHGVTNCPLIGEYLASLIGNEVSPLQQPLSDCLHPARFLLRELRRLPAGR